MGSSVECCGQQWGTNFCPTCGKRLKVDSGLRELLIHCRRTVQAFRATVIDVGGELGEMRKARLATKIDKWKRWADELQELLVKNGG